MADAPGRVPVEALPFGGQTMAFAAQAIQIHGRQRAGLADEPFGVPGGAGGGRGALRASGAVTSFAADALLFDRHRAVRFEENRPCGVTFETAGNGRSRAPRLDRLAHSLMKSSRRQRVMTG